jgi:hypothetical protein
MPKRENKEMEQQVKKDITQKEGEEHSPCAAVFFPHTELRHSLH